jgi:hypothetical protein
MQRAKTERARLGLFGTEHDVPSDPGSVLGARVRAANTSSLYRWEVLIPRRGPGGVHFRYAMGTPVAEPRIARLTIDQVHAMIETGIVHEGAPIELIDGVLVHKDRSASGEDPTSIGKGHSLVVSLLVRSISSSSSRSAVATCGPRTH